MDLIGLPPTIQEVELAKEEWTGQRYRQACRFTSIRAAVEAAGAPLKLAWGSTFASAVNKLQGGDGILADSSTLDALDASTVGLHMICQPGNGGPVEDWSNVETLSKGLPDVPLTVVNGALDKVRDGYYPAVFFPALAASTPYYDAFESVFFLKPVVCTQHNWKVSLLCPISPRRRAHIVLCFWLCNVNFTK